jgi:EAL domain-containing protein (putative c-di-GMP-specific phosphodiesterase class I)/GGDEF domain-containing protein
LLDLIRHFFARARLRHAAFAVLVALLLAAMTIFRPLDIAIWSLQSKLFNHAPSAEIVLVTNGSRKSPSSRADLNRNYSAAIKRLGEQGAKRIVIDASLQRSGSMQIDRDLRAILEQNKDRIILTRPVSKTIDQNKLVEAGSPFFERDMRIASTDIVPDFLGFVWGIEAQHSDGKNEFPSVWNIIAHDGLAKTAIWPDYAIDIGQLPQVSLAAIARGEPDVLESLRGKTIVIGGLDRDRRSLKAPDRYDGDVTASLIQIIAAETALRGEGQFAGSWITIPAFGIILLAGVCLFRKVRIRQLFYAAWLAVFAATFVLSGMTGIRVMLADPLVIALAYAMIRAGFNYRRRYLYNDPRSRLPNFAALRRNLDDSVDLDRTAIAVAKIARLDAVMASLNPNEQGQYLRQIASRLTLGDTQTAVYHDGGKYFCFLLAEADYPDLQAHLEGLRAVASQAINVSGRAIDVSMTIGVDQSGSRASSNRISHAISAADQAREAYRPVFIITDFEADSEVWDYSLQSRLEDALSENRISIKLQSQIDLKTGLFIGAEALARWADEMRGEVSPERFILQCERVGRLDELTKRILRLSLEASRTLKEKQLPARVSVNVSAIQFVDHRIADLVEQMLTDTGADPANIVIEITETARIESFSVAREIMERIARSGVQFSIDDFGVSSANLEALYRLPFSELKIDRIFANSVANMASARAITANMIKLSRDLGMVSVVEGIESFATLDMLRHMGADLGQGFIISRPETYSLLEETMQLQNATVHRRNG